MVWEISVEYLHYLLNDKKKDLTLFVDSNTISSMEKGFLQNLYETRRFNVFPSIEDKIRKAEEMLFTIRKIRELTRGKIYTTPEIKEEIGRVSLIFSETSSFNYQKSRKAKKKEHTKDWFIKDEDKEESVSLTRIEEFSNLALLWQRIVNRLGVYTKRIILEPSSEDNIPKNDYLLAGAVLKYAEENPSRITVLLSKDYHLLRILSREITLRGLYSHYELEDLPSLVLCRRGL